VWHPSRVAWALLFGNVQGLFFVLSLLNTNIFLLCKHVTSKSSCLSSFVWKCTRSYFFLSSFEHQHISMNTRDTDVSSAGAVCDAGGRSYGWNWGGDVVWLRPRLCTRSGLERITNACSVWLRCVSECCSEGDDDSIEWEKNCDSFAASKNSLEGSWMKSCLKTHCFEGSWLESFQRI